MRTLISECVYAPLISVFLVRLLQVPPQLNCFVWRCSSVPLRPLFCGENRNLTHETVWYGCWRRGVSKFKQKLKLKFNSSRSFLSGDISSEHTACFDYSFIVSQSIVNSGQFEFLVSAWRSSQVKSTLSDKLMAANNRSRCWWNFFLSRDVIERFRLVRKGSKCRLPRFNLRHDSSLIV